MWAGVRHGIETGHGECWLHVGGRLSPAGSQGDQPPNTHTYMLTPSLFTLGAALAHLKSLRSQSCLWATSPSLSLV